jgi:hypothetical protein
MTVVKLQSSPGIVLLSSKVDESFAEAVKPNAAEEYSLYLRPYLEFSFEKAKQRIIKLAEILPHAGRLVMEIPDILGEEGAKLIKMGGVIEWTKQISVLFPQYEFVTTRLDVREPYLCIYSNINLIGRKVLRSGRLLDLKCKL